MAYTAEKDVRDLHFSKRTIVDPMAAPQFYTLVLAELPAYRGPLLGELTEHPLAASSRRVPQHGEEVTPMHYLLGPEYNAIVRRWSRITYDFAVPQDSSLFRVRVTSWMTVGTINSPIWQSDHLLSNHPFFVDRRRCLIYTAFAEDVFTCDSTFS